MVVAEVPRLGAPWAPGRFCCWRRKEDFEPSVSTSSINKPANSFVRLPLQLHSLPNHCVVVTTAAFDPTAW
ncbi:hypothetical protein MLD38_011064 [Melastoma candidum]|uniref:Uncharacterized protein n=1 Tax=Melastoma candidum TaxID=119954 RepID=A0ACB9R3M5_9MYRT|nr:hypothetical protein MLD38_011064 [Melastoma candidum]